MKYFFFPYETLFTIQIRPPGSLGRMSQLARAVSPFPSQHPGHPQGQEEEELRAPQAAPAQCSPRGQAATPHTAPPGRPDTVLGAG